MLGGGAVAIDTADFGSGPTVVLVHGSLTTGLRTWERQLPLAERWNLRVVARRGYPPNPASDFSDFEVDAADVLHSFDGEAHLVGHSYGGLAVLLAAACASSRVRSVTVVETPLMALVRGAESVESMIAGHHARLRDADNVRGFYASFLGVLGAPPERVPETLDAETERLVRLLMNERPPWEVDIPIEPLRKSGVPVLVVTGGWDEVLESGADALAAALGGTAHRHVLEGRGHVVQRLGEPFNQLVEDFFARAAERPVDVPT